MKKGILFLLIIAGSIAADAQSLKDLLYSGKLKMDSNSVIRKTDDLSKRIDTGTKKPADSLLAKGVEAPGDSSSLKAKTQSDSSIAMVNTGSATTAVPDTEDAAEATASTTTAAPVKSNTRILKEYTDSLATVLKTEVLSSKKIKKDTYYLIVEYEIGADGQTTVINVISTPENSLLQEQVKERMLITPPQLAPALDSNKQPRKVKRKYSFTVTKE
jgi:hypothetical protein